MPEDKDHGKDPFNEYMDVTPEMAGRWLEEANTNNRVVRQAYVEFLARQMKAGQWHTTHEGIAFDVNGVLLDGQHRLWAIFESGTTIRLLVFFNEQPDNLSVIGGQKPRDLADQITLSDALGKKVTRHFLSVLKRIDEGLGWPKKYSVAEMIQVARSHWAAAERAVKLLPASTRKKGISSAGTRAVIARASYSRPPEKLAHFCTILKTGLVTNPDDRAAIAIRDWLIHTKIANSPSGRRDQYARVERALKAFLDGEPLQKIYPTKEELFPLPSNGSAASGPEGSGQ